MGENSMGKTVILAVIILAFAVVPVHAEGISVLAGFQTVSFGGDLGKYFDLPAGPGLVLNVGLPAIMGVPFDVTVGQRTMKEGNSNDDVKYRWVEAGPRIFLGEEGARIRPEIVAGGGLYNFELGNVEYDSATGFYAGFGFQDFATDRILGRFLVKTVYWKSDTEHTDAPSLNFSLTYGYQF
jgi:hypothetical protein